MPRVDQAARGQGGDAISHRAFRPPTNGFWIDLPRAEDWAKKWVDEFRSPTDPNNPVLYVLDLTTIVPSVGVLDQIMSVLVSVVDRRHHGPLVLVVATEDEGIRHFVQMLAVQHDLPLYLSTSPAPISVMAAEPVFPLSPTEEETLNAIVHLDGRVTAHELSNFLGIKTTATNNRLADLETKGLLFRQRRPGRQPDNFVDYRVASFETGQVVLQDGQLAGAAMVINAQS